MKWMASTTGHNLHATVNGKLTLCGKTVTDQWVKHKGPYRCNDCNRIEPRARAALELIKRGVL